MTKLNQTEHHENKFVQYNKQIRMGNADNLANGIRSVYKDFLKFIFNLWKKKWL